MKTDKTYLKFFSDEEKAHEHMRMKNRAARDRSIFCLTAGPDEQTWAVVDLATAIDLGNPYEWSVR